MVMLAFVAIIVVYGMSQPAPTHSLVSQLPAPSKPLQKPEPKWLLNLASLHLTTSQRTEIEKLDSDWQSERSKLMIAMSRYEPKQGRADQVSGQLAGYSELSRQFDQTRNQYWTASMSLLTTDQKTLALGVTK